jgi:2-polyprenyl-3-methyl-5-hydroxy-6-metoxy-1,4-benzoquinol methylase
MLSTSFQRKMLHVISKKGKYLDHNFISNEALFKKGLASSIEFFKRFNGRVDFKNRTVLDVGCGLGSTGY